MIEIKELKVKFGNVSPIDNLTAVLSAPVAGLIGPNGAGKTTLLNVFSGFVRPVAGSVHFANGIDLLALSPLERVKSGVRRFFQTEQVVEDLSVYENVAALADHVCSSRTRRDDVEKALEFANISKISRLQGHGLNLFQRRLVEISKAVLGNPKLILLDEPAAGLTAEEGQIISDLVLQLPDFCGAQTIVIDHDVELIRRLCKETLVLDYGRKLALGPTEDVLSHSEVRRAYLGEL